MAEKWNKELDCDWLNYCKGLVTDCTPKLYICKKLQADCKVGENNYFWKKKVVICKSPLRVMILRKSKKILQSDCGFDNLMGSQTFELSDSVKTLNPSNEEVALDQVAFDTGRRRRRR